MAELILITLMEAVCTAFLMLNQEQREAVGLMVNQVVEGSKQEEGGEHDGSR